MLKKYLELNRDLLNWIKDTPLAIGVLVGVFVYGLLTVLPIGLEPVAPARANSSATCPDGSYEIGYDETYDKPICKLEPTGCPFGDSVPLDKCAPPPDIICNEDWTKCEPKKEESDPINEVPANDPRSTPSKEEQPESSTCSK